MLYFTLWIISLMSSDTCNSHAVSQVTLPKQYRQHVFLPALTSYDKTYQRGSVLEIEGMHSPSLLMEVFDLSAKSAH